MLDSARTQSPVIQFRGGAYASLIPITVFLGITIILCVQGAPTVEGMIMAAMCGLACGLFWARNIGVYSECVFTLMANRIVTVAIACWLWAGAFSGILSDSGLVEAIVWIGWKWNLHGNWFTLAVFVSSAFFSVSVGTGLGTVVGFTTVMYPAGILLGASPPALMGAIISGAAFGDNLAPISDTTIVSAATQETDVGGVVRSRFKYAAVAGLAAMILFVLFGGGPVSGDSEEAQMLLSESADPKALPMLLPAFLVFAVALLGGHFLAALTLGIIAAMVIGPVMGIISLDRIISISPNGIVEGCMVKGVMAFLPISMLTLLVIASFGFLEKSGLLQKLLHWVENRAGASLRKTEFGIILLTTIANLCVPSNTIAMTTIGPLVNHLRKVRNIHPYRSANLLDSISCTFPYFLPYGAIIVAASAIQHQMHDRYAFVMELSWTIEALYMFYGWALMAVMIVAVWTGFGRKSG